MNYSDETADEMAKLQDEIDAGNLWDLDAQVEQAMDALRCPPGDAKSKRCQAARSGACALPPAAGEARHPLADEPTNHLDAESVAWLEHHLRDYPGAVVMVTHDRYFLQHHPELGCSSSIAGPAFPITAAIPPGSSRNTSGSRWKASRTRPRKRTSLPASSTGSGASPKARQAKSKARIKAYDELVAEAGRDTNGKAQITIPPGPRLGNMVIEAEHIGKGFGDRLLVDDLSFKLPPGGIVGVIGPNGAGKTTLFRMIVGQDKPDNGAIRVGDTVKLG